MKRHVQNFDKFEEIFEQFINEKKKIDQDGDGDTDFVDAKIAQYSKGGIPKDKAIAKAKMFAKKNNIKDGNKKSLKESFWNRWRKPDIDDAAHDSLRGQGHSHRGTEADRQYIMHDGQKFYEDDIEYADYNDTGRIPRVEGGKLIIANPNWSN